MFFLLCINSQKVRAIPQLCLLSGAVTATYTEIIVSSQINGSSGFSRYQIESHTTSINLIEEQRIEVIHEDDVIHLVLFDNRENNTQYVLVHS